MMERQVFCIVREKPDDPNSAIYKIGGIDWQYNVDEVHAIITNKKGSFYVKDEKGNAVNVIVVEEKDGFRHFRTTPDKSKINNLESLRSCGEDKIVDLAASYISRTSKQL